MLHVKEGRLEIRFDRGLRRLTIAHYYYANIETRQATTPPPPTSLLITEHKQKL